MTKHFLHLTNAILIVTSVFLSGCELQVEGPGGIYKIGPPGMPAGPAEPVKVGTFNYEGVDLCLMDLNGDGIADYVYDSESGRWYPITPPNVAPRTPSPVSSLCGEAGMLAAAQPGVLPETSVGPGDWDWLATYIDWSSGFDPSVPFDFAGLTAEQWIESAGLDVDPDVGGETEALQLVSLDTDTWQCEAWLYWSSALGMPDLSDVDLQHEVYGRPSTVGGPAFFAFHVAGDVQELARLCLQTGGEEFTLIHDGSTWTVVLDADFMTAELYRDDVWQITVPLD